MLTIEEVKAAYDKIGFRPKKYTCYEDGKQCCALDALCLANNISVGNYEWIKKLYGDFFVCGFLNGFDYGRIITREAFILKSEFFKTGFVNGCQIKKQLVEIYGEF